MRGFYSIIMLTTAAWMVYGQTTAGQTLGVATLLWIIYMFIQKLDGLK